MSRDVLVVLGFDDGAKAWSDDYHNHKFDCDNDHAFDDVTWDILRSIRVLCTYVIEDTEKFVQTMNERLFDAVEEPFLSFVEHMLLISRQTYKGRQKPSRSRLQFLLCLEDCCRISLLGLEDAAALIEELYEATKLKSPGREQKLRAWFEETKIDIEYLQGELKAAHHRILDVRAMVCFIGVIETRSYRERLTFHIKDRRPTVSSEWSPDKHAHAARCYLHPFLVHIGQSTIYGLTSDPSLYVL